MFVCVCCESKTEKEEQNCEKTHMIDTERRGVDLALVVSIIGFPDSVISHRALGLSIVK